MLARGSMTVQGLLGLLVGIGGYAIEIAPALAVDMTVAQQEPKGDFFCGWTGVQVSPMTAAFAESLGMTEVYGAIFDQPEPGSPAAAAGIEAGDVLTAINGARLVHARDFAQIISATAPGTTVYLDTWRDREAMQVRLVLGSIRCRSP
jgi:serine protease Do